MADSPALPYPSPEAYRASAPARLPWTGLAALFIVYTVWSSTYLAIRVAVRDGSGFPPFAMAALLGASLAWSLGTVLQQRRPVAASPQVSSAYQLLVGGVAFLALTLALREPVPHPTPEAWLAWLYLVVFGSLLAFTAYIAMLRLLPANIAMTYSYVNPAVAVFLGWLLLGEPLTLWTLGGVALVLLGVGGVYRARH